MHNARGVSVHIKNQDSRLPLSLRSFLNSHDKSRLTSLSRSLQVVSSKSACVFFLPSRLACLQWGFCATGPRSDTLPATLPSPAVVQTFSTVWDSLTCSPLGPKSATLVQSTLAPLGPEPATWQRRTFGSEPQQGPSQLETPDPCHWPPSPVCPDQHGGASQPANTKLATGSGNTFKRRHQGSKTSTSPNDAPTAYDCKHFVHLSNSGHTSSHSL